MLDSGLTAVKLRRAIFPVGVAYRVLRAGVIQAALPFILRGGTACGYLCWVAQIVDCFAW